MVMVTAIIRKKTLGNPTRALQLMENHTEIDGVVLIQIPMVLRIHNMNLVG